MAAFLLALGSLLLVGGALDDRYDSWRIVAIGTAGFGAAALVSALAPNMALLLVGRLLQGATAALLIPSVLAVITSTFSGDERSRAIGTWTAWSGVSVILGPVFGGLLVGSLSWRAPYGALVPFSALVLVLILRASPSELGRSEGAVDLAADDVVGASNGADECGRLQVRHLLFDHFVDYETGTSAVVECCEQAALDQFVGGAANPSAAVVACSSGEGIADGDPVPLPQRSYRRSSVAVNLATGRSSVATSTFQT